MKLNKYIFLLFLLLNISCSIYTDSEIENNKTINNDPNSELYKLIKTEDVSKINLNDRYKKIRNKNNLSKEKIEKEFIERYKTNDFKTIYTSRSYTLIYLWEDFWATCIAAKPSVKELEDKLNTNEIILYSIQVSKTRVGELFASYMKNTNVPTTYLINNKLEIIDQKTVTPDIWFNFESNKNNIKLLMGSEE